MNALNNIIQIMLSFPLKKRKNNNKQANKLKVVMYLNIIEE